jgi:hypothetical protein
MGKRRKKHKGRLPFSANSTKPKCAHHHDEVCSNVGGSVYYPEQGGEEVQDLFTYSWMDLFFPYKKRTVSLSLLLCFPNIIPDY